MRSPEDFPADIIAAAEIAVDRGWNEGVLDSICRALMERDRAATERAAKIAESHMNPLGTRSWDGDAIAAAIRSQP
jgi:hypothetical protein